MSTSPVGCEYGNRAAGVVRITKGCMYVSTMNIVMQDKVRSCARLARVVPHGALA
jgi:hypothetical protein